MSAAARPVRRAVVMFGRLTLSLPFRSTMATARLSVVALLLLFLLPLHALAVSLHEAPLALLRTRGLTAAAGPGVGQRGARGHRRGRDFDRQRRSGEDVVLAQGRAAEVAGH